MWGVYPPHQLDKMLPGSVIIRVEKGRPNHFGDLAVGGAGVPPPRPSTTAEAERSGVASILLSGTHAILAAYRYFLFVFRGGHNKARLHFHAVIETFIKKEKTKMTTKNKRLQPLLYNLGSSMHAHTRFDRGLN